MASLALLGLGALTACTKPFSEGTSEAGGRDAASDAPVASHPDGASSGARDAAGDVITLPGRDAAVLPGDSGGSNAAEAGRDAATEPVMPTDGLVLWLRADRGITEANGRVSIWADQSPAHADALQTASNLRPRLVQQGIGNRPSVEFDGADDYLRLPPGFSDFGAGVSIFAVVRAVAPASCSAVVEFSNGSEIDDVSFGVYNGSILYEVLDSSHSSGTFVFGAPQEMAVLHRPDESLQVRRNGGSEGEDTFALPAVIERQEAFVGRTLYVGCETFGGLIAEILVYDRAVTDRELLTIEASLGARWACCTN